MDMSAFLQEGGLKDAIEEEKKNKKIEEERKRKEVKLYEDKAKGHLSKQPEQTKDEEESKVVDDVPDVEANDCMEGLMHIKKTTLDKKSKGFAGLPSLHIDLNLGNLGLLEKKPMYFAIKNGILYQFERKTARVNIDRFKIDQISALDMKIENN